MREPLTRDEQERRFDFALADLLRFGTLIAAIVVATGGIVDLNQAGTSPPSYHVFQGEPSQLRGFSTVFGNAFSGDGKAIIPAGLVLLIAIPFARVRFSEFVFLKERDWVYSVMTLIVLATLAVSLLAR